MKTKTGVIIVLLVLVLITSCQQPINSDFESSKEEINPYSLNYMQKVHDELVELGEAEAKQIEPTHLYLKFSPMNKEEVDMLSCRKDLELYDSPIAAPGVETEASRSGNYRDPNVLDSQPNPLYGAVAIGTSLPDVAYTVLDKLYIPEEIEIENEEEFTIEEAALAMYEDDIDDFGVSRGRLRDRLRRIRRRIRKRRESRKWNPSARIRVWDDSLGRLVPLAGVEVRVRNWFRSHQGHTDSNGNYYSPTKFRGDVSYFLKYEYKNERFDVRNGHFGQAFFNGPNNKRSKWNLDIVSGINLFWAQTFKAGAYLLDRNTGVFGSVPFRALTICALDKNGSKRSGMFNSFNNNVWIYRNLADGSRRSSRDIFNVVQHEIGHRLQDKYLPMERVDTNLKESWAEAVGYVMTEAEYGVNERDINQDHIHDQFWTSGDYTPMIIDLIDNHDQSTRSTTSLSDPITGYTLRQMWDIIKKRDVRTRSDFVDEVNKLTLPTGVTRAMLDNYFNQY